MLNLLFTTFYAIGNCNARNELNHIGKGKESEFEYYMWGDIFWQKEFCLAHTLYHKTPTLDERPNASMVWRNEKRLREGSRLIQTRLFGQRSKEALSPQNIILLELADGNIVLLTAKYINCNREKD